METQYVLKMDNISKKNILGTEFLKMCPLP